MRRTLFAVGIVVLLSMLFAPVEESGGCNYCFENRGVLYEFEPIFLYSIGKVLWIPFITQTIFAAILIAVVVNLFSRAKKN